MIPERRLALLDQGLRALADAVAVLRLPPVCGSPDLLLIDRSRPSDAAAPDVPLRHLPPVAAALRPLAKAGAVFLQADAEIALAHAPPLAHAWRRPGSPPVPSGAPPSRRALLRALDVLALPDGTSLAGPAESAHARLRRAATLDLLPPSIRAEIAAIDQAARGPGAPPCGALRWRRLPRLRLLWHDGRDVPDGLLRTEE